MKSASGVLSSFLVVCSLVYSSDLYDAHSPSGPSSSNGAEAGTPDALDGTSGDGGGADAAATGCRRRHARLGVRSTWPLSPPRARAEAGRA
jgi:hypothetical protein